MERPDKVPKTYKTPRSFGRDDTIKLINCHERIYDFKELTETAYIVQEFS